MKIKNICFFPFDFLTTKKNIPEIKRNYPGTHPEFWVFDSEWSVYERYNKYLNWFNYPDTFGKYVLMKGAEKPPILAIREHMPTPEERIVVGNSSAVYM